MAKKVAGFLKLQVPAAAANPAPPIGPALGQRGLNIMQFCKDFNAQTQKMEKGMPIPVTITIYQDKSFTFELRTPPVSYFLKKAAKLQTASKTPGREPPGPGAGRAGIEGAGQGNRAAEDEGLELRHDRSRDEHDRGFRPLHGHSGDGVGRCRINPENAFARRANPSKR